MAPINLPDGSQVSEIVLPDGSTASEVLAPDGSTVFGNAIPDSGLLHNWDVQSQSSADPLVDQESNNDLTANFSASITSEGINSFDSIEIPTGGDFYEGGYIPVGGGGEYTIAFVGRWLGQSDFAYLYANGDLKSDGYALAANNSGPVIVQPGGGTSDSGGLDTSLYIYIITYDGSTGLVERDGNTILSGSMPAPSLSSGSFSLGGDHIDDTGDGLELGQFLAYDEHKNSSERTEIRQYLKERWEL